MDKLDKILLYKFSLNRGGGPAYRPSSEELPLHIVSTIKKGTEDI